MDAKKRGKPYSITFCGVNGVGKSTNLAKVMDQFEVFTPLALSHNFALSEKKVLMLT